ncbi:MAG TPA: Uma2 family endonuclease [Pyrinomonadaceae bacterium]|nr:Uma2 family endonuclease [Pyrinomonadaceae bacterium]
MSTTTHLMTAEELFDLPEGHRYELVKGVLLTMSPSGYAHGRVTMKLSNLLTNYINANYLGIPLAAETGFKLECDPDTVLAPDFAFIRQEPAVGHSSGFVESSPDLAVEVISSTKSRRQAERKAAQWLSFGVQSVWVVSCQKKTIEIFSATGLRQIFKGSDELSDEDLLPGFRVRVAEIFN